MLNKSTGTAILLLRIFLGWLMFYSGISQVTNVHWSAAEFLKSAITCPQLYGWLASPSVLPTINFLNSWGLTLLGLSLIFGLLVRLSSSLGMVLMLLYYLPGLSFPFIRPNGCLVDDHIIYLFVLYLFIVSSAGRIYGLDSIWTKTRFAKKHPKITKFLA